MRLGNAQYYCVKWVAYHESPICNEALKDVLHSDVIGLLKQGWFYAFTT